ncbi:MAG: helix-turn-helix transcriptional regulator [Haloarculaceae archaeon]
MSSRAHIALLSVLALAVLTAPVLAAPVSQDGPDTAMRQTSASGPTAERTVMTVQLADDGDARWTVAATFVLQSDAERASFRELADEFRNGDTAALGLDAFRQASAAASDATGREMTVRDVNRTYEIENSTGRLVLAFTWTNFGRSEGDQLVVGDAFNTSTGTWLPGLTENQTLVVRPPEGYGVRSSPPKAVENGTLRWKGPTTFEPGYLHIVYTGATGTEPGNGPATSTTTPGDNSLQGVVRYWPGGVVFVGLVLVVVYLSTQGQLTTPTARDGEADAPDSGGETTTADAQQPTDEPPADEEDDIDEELLSDEERVERLLDQNGGRMKQAAIVKETGWSNAKVSQLLSAMEEDGRIDKLRIGRENLISFPDEDLGEFDE